MRHISTSRRANSIHGALVGVALAAFVYIVVPRFRPILDPLGRDLPRSTRLLFALYPWVFVVPLFSMAGAYLVPRASRRAILVVLGTYVVAAAVIVFVFWALYSPMYDLAAAG